MRAAVIALTLALGSSTAHPLALEGGGNTGGGGATEALRARDAEIRAALPPTGAAATPEARRKIEAIVSRTVDLRAMAEAALGARWKAMSAKERKRLLAAFEKRFRRISSSELGTYRSTAIEYKPEVAVDDLVKVPTKVVVKGEPTEIIYSMRRQTAGWRIVDITVDGVSTVENYRASFARVISKEGVDGLIRRLERGAVVKRG
jgi:phospholipid transport system substrate-binding protein